MFRLIAPGDDGTRRPEGRTARFLVPIGGIVTGSGPSRPTTTNFRYFYVFLAVFLLMMVGGGVFFYPAMIPAQTGNGGETLVLKDHRKVLNGKYRKVKRRSTEYIIVHTSEGGLASTLKTLSKGKKSRSFKTVGGHAHYAIARDGAVYYLLAHEYRADHAGLSMWNGKTDISDCSVGIELVGYHYADITPEQYKSLEILTTELRRIYEVPGKNVLTHCQIAYGNPNQWIKKLHRGRKRCALNFDRSRIGLGDQYWSYDPDVEARRLEQDRSIFTVFYKPHLGEKSGGSNETGAPIIASGGENPADNALMAEMVADSNIISKENTAWNIAGEDYNSPSTVYLLPDERQVRGDSVAGNVGWDKLPAGTRVLLNQSSEEERPKGPIFRITRDFTAWSYVGKKFNAAATFYFFQNGGFVSGERVKDWDALPEGASLISGYKEPAEIGAMQGKTPWSIAGREYNSPETIYFIPENTVKRGDEISNFNDLPRGSLIFVKIR